MRNQARAVGRAASVAVLASGGVESAALLVEAMRRFERVYPLYVRKGFVWETVELAHLKRLLRRIRQDGLAGLTVLEAPLKDVYRAHWSLGKERIPGAKEPDSAVYLPGRNLLLLGLAGLFCSVRKIPTVWIGVLRGNPFRDAGKGFLAGMERLLKESLGRPVRIAAPLARSTKGRVIRKYPDLPWQFTFSCLNPAGRLHCGRCQKCAERKAGFRAAGVEDPTRYATVHGEPVEP